MTVFGISIGDKKKSINLYNQYDETKKKKLKNQIVALCVCPFVIVVLILGGLYANAIISTNSIKDDTKSLKAEFKTLKQQKLKAVLLSEENMTYTKDIESLTYIQSEKKINDDKNSTFGSSLFSTIKKSGGANVAITGTTFADDTLTLSLKTQHDDPLYVSQFVKNLRALKKSDGSAYFTSVSYSGYTGGEDYTFTVICSFK